MVRFVRRPPPVRAPRVVEGRPVPEGGERGAPAAFGMALILFSGVLVGFSLFGLLILQVAILRTKGIRLGVALTESRLSAVSGLAYAGARLWEEWRPEKIPTAAGARDDWTVREADVAGASPGRLKNPSYARGDAWIDAADDGRYTEGVDALAPGGDLDGNGAFDACTGFLRGGGPQRALRFSVAVRSAAGLVCVNSGETGSAWGDHDLDGILNGADPDYDVDADGNNVPDWMDPDFVGNRHLVNLLDNLGAVLGVSTAREDLYDPTRPATDPVNAIAYTTSDLGRQVVAARPRGGYVALSQLRTVLGADDFNKAAPYLSTLGDVVPVAFPPSEKKDMLWSHAADPEARYEFHARIDLNAAPLETLQAALRYIAASGTYWRDGSGGIVAQTPFVRLQRDEADAIAAEIAKARPIRTWRRLLAVLSSPAIADDGTVFREDPLCAVYDAACDGPARRRLKEDLILAQADANGVWPDPASWRRGTLEVAREEVTRGVDGAAPRRIFKGALAGPLNSAPFAADGSAPAASEASLVANLPTRMTTEFSLFGAAAGIYAVAADGWRAAGGGRPLAAARAAGELRVGGALVLTGQQDFDRLPRSLAAPGADDRWHVPGGGAWTDACAQERAGLQSGPRFPLTTGVVDSDGVPVPNYLPESVGWNTADEEAAVRAAYAYPAALGSVGLSAYLYDVPTELEGTCVFALPFDEDAPGGAGAATWLDNVGDPVARGAQAPMAFRLAANQNLPGGWANLHQGIRWSGGGPVFSPTPPPMPPLLGSATGPLSVEDSSVTSVTEESLIPAAPPLCIRAEWSAAAFPLPRDAMGGLSVEDATVESPSEDLAPASGIGEIRQGTIEFWCPDQGGEAPIEGFAEGELALRYAYDDDALGRPIYHDYLRVRMLADGRIRLQTPVPPSGTVMPVNAFETTFLPGDEAPAEPLAGTGWRHVALVFSDAGLPEDETRVTVYRDGVSLGSAIVRFNPTLDPDGRMAFDVSAFPIDDVLFHAESLDASTLQARAAGARYFTSGRLRTARFTFDPARHPLGVRLRGAAWDTFIPESTGGSFRFEAVSSAGTSGPWEWDLGHWKDGVEPPLIGFRVPGARDVEVRVHMEAYDDDPTGLGRWLDAWPRLNGQPTLRDTHVLDEFVLYYADRPVWSGVSVR